MLRRVIAPSGSSALRCAAASRHAASSSSGAAEEFDALIIGSGIVGCSTALDLARRGLRVAVVDSKASAGDGTTSFSSGIIRTFYSTVEVTAVALESYKMWMAWRDFLRLPTSTHPSLTTVRSCGSLLPVVEYTGAGAEGKKHEQSDYYEQRVVPCSREVGGIPHEFLNYEQMMEKLRRVGWTNMEEVYTPRMHTDDRFDEPIEGLRYKGAWFYPETAYVSDPRQATQDVQAATMCTDAGVATPVKYYFNKTVTAVTKSGDRTAVEGLEMVPTAALKRIAAGGGNDKEALAALEKTRLRAPIVVNCSGPWSKKVNAMIFADAAAPSDNKISTRALRTDVAVVDAPAGCDIDKDGQVVMDLEAGFYMKPDTNNRLMVGGVESPCDPFEWLECPDEVDGAEPGPIYDASVYRTALRVPTLDIPTGRSKRFVVSAYDVTDDWNPIVDRSNLRGLYQVIGTSGNCFKTAPVLGQVIGELITRERSGAVPLEGPKSHDESPITVHLDRINRDISTALFHRKREVRKGSFVLA